MRGVSMSSYQIARKIASIGFDVFHYGQIIELLRLDEHLKCVGRLPESWL